jgi:hypothetical protein
MKAHLKFLYSAGLAAVVALLLAGASPAFAQGLPPDTIIDGFDNNPAKRWTFAGEQRWPHQDNFGVFTNDPDGGHGAVAKLYVKPSIINGAVVDPTTTQTVRITAPLGCSGVLLTNEWVVTANHCFLYGTTPGQIQVTYGDGTGQQRQGVAELLRHPSSINNAQFIDVVLLRLAAPMLINGSLDRFQQRIWPGESPTLDGKTFECVGYGLADLTICSNTCARARNGTCEDGGRNSASAVCAFETDCTDCGSRASATNTARRALLAENGISINVPLGSGTEGDVVEFAPNAQNQITAEGDSGGGCFVTDGGVRYLASVNKAWRACATQGGCKATGGYGGGNATLLTTPWVRDWIMRTAYHRRSRTLLAHGENCANAALTAGSQATTWDCGPFDTATAAFSTHFTQQSFQSDDTRFRFSNNLALGTRPPTFSNHSLLEVNTFSGTSEETFRFRGSEIVGLADKCVDVSNCQGP